ncbi:MAG TPA: hypothetical protein VGM10_34315 [Actinocrinis sp.]|jgi:hypothetical protein
MEERRDEPAQEPLECLGTDTQPEPATPATSSWWRTRPVAAIAATAPLAVAFVAGWLVHSPPAGNPDAAVGTLASASTSAQITLNGAITLGPFDGTDTAPGAATAVHDGDPCVATGGYTDISQGVAVTVGNQTGQTIGVGSLDAGTITGQAGGPGQCQFSFSVPVPASESLYTVTISHRGTQTFTPAQVENGTVALTLGD